jgi:hypothetical protein
LCLAARQDDDADDLTQVNLAGIVAANEEVAGAPRRKKLRGSTSGDDKNFLEVFLYAEQQQAKKEAKREAIRREERQHQSMMWMGTITAIATAMTGNKVDLPLTSLIPNVVTTSAGHAKVDDDNVSVSSSIFSSDDSKIIKVDKAKKKKKFLERLQEYKLRKALKKKQKKNAKNYIGRSSGSSSSGSEIEVDALDIYSKSGSKNRLTETVTFVGSTPAPIMYGELQYRSEYRYS